MAEADGDHAGETGFIPLPLSKHTAANWGYKIRHGVCGVYEPEADTTRQPERD